MIDLMTWLRAQLDEDERRLRLMDEHLSGHDRPYDLGDPTDPARVLREVESKRAIVNECAETLSYASPHYTVESCDETDAILAEHIIRALALPYADRPGYRDEWRP